MCRMLGMIGKPPLPIQDTLKSFYPLCTEGCVKKGMNPGHLDGWGISGFSAERAVYFARRAEPASEGGNNYTLATERAIKSIAPVVIAHFRKASEATLGIPNTHPFHNRDWVFAHNGTIYGAAASFPLYDAEPQGQTDSERFFLWMWEQIHAETDPTTALAAVLKKAREQLVFTSLNFLMSDGKQLWAYRDFGDKRLEKGETIADREAYYTLYSTTIGQSAVICSEPLMNLSKTWTPMGQRALAVYSADKIVPQLLKI
jgi:predicted glutamine amidotransferase